MNIIKSIITTIVASFLIALLILFSPLIIISVVVYKIITLKKNTYLIVYEYQHKYFPVRGDAIRGDFYYDGDTIKKRDKTGLLDFKECLLEHILETDIHIKNKKINKEDIKLIITSIVKLD